METLPPADSAVVQRIASDLKGRPGPLLEVLHAIQAALGYVPAGAVPVVAEVLNLSRAEVHGVVTFYHYFRRSRRRAAVKVVRNGSRGAYWLEPLVEVLTPLGRLAYGPVTAADVAGLFDADFLNGGSHALSLGPTGEIAWLKGQQRLTFERVGIIEPTSVADYVTHGGYQGLTRALSMEPAAIVQAITTSGLRGRGGAAFPTGIKWKTVLDQPA